LDAPTDSGPLFSFRIDLQELCPLKCHFLRKKCGKLSIPCCIISWNTNIFLIYVNNKTWNYLSAYDRYKISAHLQLTLQRYEPLNMLLKIDVINLDKYQCSCRSQLSVEYWLLQDFTFNMYYQGHEEAQTTR
jgi:hypothetical protein